MDNLTTSDIQNLIGHRIILRKFGNEVLELEVINVDTSSSILNKKNIFILVKNKILPNEIPKKSEVYTLE